MQPSAEHKAGPASIHGDGSQQRLTLTQVLADVRGLQQARMLRHSYKFDVPELLQFWGHTYNYGMSRSTASILRGEDQDQVMKMAPGIAIKSEDVDGSPDR